MIQHMSTCIFPSFYLYTFTFYHYLKYVPESIRDGGQDAQMISEPQMSKVEGRTSFRRQANGRRRAESGSCI